MFKYNFDSVVIAGIGLLARDSSPEETFNITPAPPVDKTARMIA